MDNQKIIIEILEENETEMTARAEVNCTEGFAIQGIKELLKSNKELYRVTSKAIVQIIHEEFTNSSTSARIGSQLKDIIENNKRN